MKVGDFVCSNRNTDLYSEVPSPESLLRILSTITEVPQHSVGVVIDHRNRWVKWLVNDHSGWSNEEHLTTVCDVSFDTKNIAQKIEERVEA